MSACALNLDLRGHHSRNSGFTMKAGTKKWIKAKLNRVARRQPISLDFVTHYETPTDPHLAYHRGSVVAWVDAESDSDSTVEFSLADAILKSLDTNPYVAARRTVAWRSALRNAGMRGVSHEEAKHANPEIANLLMGV